MNEEFKEMSSDEQFKVLQKYGEFNQIEARRQNLASEVQRNQDQMNRVLKATFNQDDDVTFIEKKVAACDCEDENAFRALLQEKGIKYFFTDPDTGEEVSVADAIPKEKVTEFKRDYLVFLFNNMRCMAGIEEEQRKCDEAVAEFDRDSKEVTNMLAENVLTYTKHVRATVDPETQVGKKILRSCDYIDSAYNFKVIFDMFERYPNARKNLLRDFNKTGSVSDIGKRYFTKLNSAKITSSLLPFAASKPEESLEYKVLAPTQYKKGQEDLFIFTMIRFFAMESWSSDADVRKFHSSLIVALKRLVNGAMDEETAGIMTESMAKLIELINS
jgi:hypothetical protein